MCSGGAGFIAAGICTGGRLTRLEGAGLGVVVRVPGARSVWAGAEDVRCGKLPGACSFASFLSSFCTRPLSISKLSDQKRIADLSSSILSGLRGFRYKCIHVPLVSHVVDAGEDFVPM